jgi:hypothetical protein
MPPGSCGNCVREKASHVRMSLHLDSGQTPFTRLLKALRFKDDLLMLLQVDWSVEYEYIRNAFLPKLVKRLNQYVQ